MATISELSSPDLSKLHSHGDDALKPLFIGVTGGTASGKTSLCKRIMERFSD